MKKDIEGYILWLNKIKAGKRRAMSLVLAMSIAVSGNVFWLMRGVGTALTDDPVCGLTEHTHTEDCYERVLVCEEEHEHTDECYEERLICGLEEHIHTDECYEHEALQREAASDWEATIPELTGVYSADLMSVAISQIGYLENDDNYTRYGDWYGNPAADWNVMFVSFCLHYAGIDAETIPYGSGCWAWQVGLDNAGLTYTDLTVLPQCGDLLLLDNDDDGKCDRAGVIVDVTDNIISTIEGDVEGKVDACAYTADSSEVYGYVSVNALNETNEDDVQEQPEETVATVDFSAVTASGITVNVTAPEGAFPEGAVMSASDVDDEDVIALAASNVSEDKELKSAVAVDITFTDSEGNEIEPAEGFDVNVSIAFPENRNLSGSEFSLYHVDEGSAVEVEGAQVSQNEASFTTDSFSIYVVTATGTRNMDNVHAWIENAGMGVMRPHRHETGSGELDDYIVNDAKYPYILRVGDTIEIIGHNDNGTANFSVSHYGWYNPSTQTISIAQERINEHEVKLTITALRETGWTSNPFYNVDVPEDDPYYDRSKDIRDSAWVQLDGTDEIFYVQVNAYNENDLVIDMDTIADYDWTDDSIANYTVPFGTTVTVVGTPNPDPDDYWSTRGIFIDPDDSWVITNNTNQVQLSDGRYQRTIAIDRYNEGDRNYQILTLRSPGSNTWKKIRINVSNSGSIDHADIEIADGGIYTNVQIEGGDNGELYKTVTEYQSFVYDVNYSEMHDAQGNVVQFYNAADHYAPFAVSRFIGGIPGKHPVDLEDYNDYWSDYRYVPGNSQYELTSKYTCPPGELFSWNNARWSSKRFFYQDIDSAVFDVELQIIPRRVQKYIWDADANDGTGGWVEMAGSIEYDLKYDQGTGGQYRTRTDGGEWSELRDLKPISEGGIVDYKNEVFNLGRQAVIDAYNKCPNHTGLDFTVHHDLATIEITASKVLTGRELQNGEFTFNIYDNVNDAISTSSPIPIASATNDANGKVVFENIEFENVTGEHTYTYYMKEVPGSETNMIYDPVIYKIVIDVNKVYPGAGTDGKDLVVPVDIRSFTRLKDGGDPTNDNDYLPADQFVFHNIVDEYRLPNTGGGGIVPFLAVGTVLIGSAITLLMLRRRKEVDL
ncbi:MAG: LPXTG cell wall anchor domain-containing protein [Clostridiales bacterium]|nr:LPXTG cell wall anchor domain-containing protein [Clostridiales bacterium]